MLKGFFQAVGTVIGTIAAPIVGIFQTDAETKQIEKEGTLKLKKAKIRLKQAKVEAKIADQEARSKHALAQQGNDISYDMQVLRNRATSWLDELIVSAFVLLIALHFIPATQPYMASGWRSMGYDSAPWWLEFAILGILVSTLGLMGVLRVFVSKIGQKKG